MHLVRLSPAAGLLLLININQAFSQTCPGANPLSQSQVENLVGGKYACADLGGNEVWDELHNGGPSSPGGVVLDYKKGPSDSVDPSDTVAHPTGSYVIGSNGVITYTYPGVSTSPQYQIYDPNSSAPNPGTYTFCTQNGGLNLTVTVASAHCY
jgi:hypothetical protein